MGGKQAGDRGSAPLELLGSLPILLFILLLMTQVLMAAWTLARAEWAAWDGARAYARGADAEQIESAVRSVVGTALRPPVELGGNGCWAEVRIKVDIPVTLWIMERTGVSLPAVPAYARYPRLGEGSACR